MINFFQFIFSSVWVFFGFILLLIVAGSCLESIIEAFIPDKTIINNSILENLGFSYKGIIDHDDPNKQLPQKHEPGWVFEIASSGTYLGRYCKKGDFIICIKQGDCDIDSDWEIVYKGD